MTAERPTVARLEDARQYAERICRIASGGDAGLSERDAFAIRYCLAVMGEALDKVPETLLANKPEIPWRRVIALRHRLVHGYWLIDQGILAEIVHTEIAPLITALDRIVAKVK